MKRTTMSLVTVIYLAFAAQSFAQKPKAASQPSNLSFQTVLLPLRPLGINPELVAATRSITELETINQQLSQWLSQTSTLTENLDESDLTINQRRFSDKIMLGKPKDRMLQNVLLEPIWCSLADRYVFFLQAATRPGDLLLQSTHLTVDRDVFKKSLAEELEAKNKEQLNNEPGKEEMGPNEKAFNTLVSQIFNDLASDLANRLTSKARPETRSILKVGFDLTRLNDRQDQGTSQCLNLLLMEKLTAEFRLTRTTGYELLETYRLLTKSPSPIQRPNRMLKALWQLSPDQGGGFKLPIKYLLSLRTSESVFGNRISVLKNQPYEFTLNKETKKIEFEVDQSTPALLRKEAKTLAKNDLPQVAKVYGAWVYLDRGRAYGLKISDRLVVVGDKDGIKGHVVGFYGPSENLVSPRGFEIKEGAIVFVRKGQKKTKIGQTLDFDPQTYPTSWPPKQKK